MHDTSIVDEDVNVGFPLSQNLLTDTTADPAAGTPHCCFHGLYEASQQPFLLSLSCDKPWPDRN